MKTRAGVLGGRLTIDYPTPMSHNAAQWSIVRQLLRCPCSKTSMRWTAVQFNADAADEYAARGWREERAQVRCYGYGGDGCRARSRGFDSPERPYGKLLSGRRGNALTAYTHHTPILGECQVARACGHFRPEQRGGHPVEAGRRSPSFRPTASA
jgi:hypothetical protein